MSKKSVEKLLNEQVTKEFYSAYLYFDLANFYAEKGLNGFANWFNVQAKEELDHAVLFNNYMHQNDMHVSLAAIEKPEADTKDLISPMKQALQHEKYVTGLVNNLCAAAHDEKDFRTLQFLDWFVKEQAEEENNVRTNLQRMELFGQDAKALYNMDAELGARVYAAPTLVI